MVNGQFISVTKENFYPVIVCQVNIVVKMILLSKLFNKIL